MPEIISVKNFGSLSAQDKQLVKATTTQQEYKLIVLNAIRYGK